MHQLRDKCSDSMYAHDGWGHKLELRSSRNDLTNHTKSISRH